jgi:hypothetical protein
MSMFSEDNIRLGFDFRTQAGISFSTRTVSHFVSVNTEKRNGLRFPDATCASIYREYLDLRSRVLFLFCNQNTEKSFDSRTQAKQLACLGSQIKKPPLLVIF